MGHQYEQLQEEERSEISRLLCAGVSKAEIGRRMRSLLFVPANRSDDLARALACGADGLILDLEDSVAAADKQIARERARAFILEVRAEAPRPQILVRVNALDSGEIEADLDAIAYAGPDAIVLPNSAGGADIQRLSAKLAVREAESGAPDGAIGILAFAAERAAALFTLATYALASQRLFGLTWGAEKLSADLGAEASRTDDGELTKPYRLARSLVLYAAASAGVDAFDGVFANLSDQTGLLAECAAARRDGFVGKLAIHPDQIASINHAFTPSTEAIERARKVVSAFSRRPQTGAAALDSETGDRSRLGRAERLLGRIRGA